MYFCEWASRLASHQQQSEKALALWVDGAPFAHHTQDNISQQRCLLADVSGLNFPLSDAASAAVQ